METKKLKFARWFRPDEIAETCIVCGSPFTQTHHIFHGTTNRAKAEYYGYTVPLCVEHHTGRSGVHFNRQLDLMLRETAQKHFEENYGSRQDFIREFGKSVL